MGETLRESGLVASLWVADQLLGLHAEVCKQCARAEARMLWWSNYCREGKGLLRSWAEAEDAYIRAVGRIDTTRADNP